MSNTTEFASSPANNPYDNLVILPNIYYNNEEFKDIKGDYPMLERLRKTVEDKDVLILGFGREGKSSLAMIQKVGGYKSITISDMNPVEAGDIPVISGEHYLDVVNDFDVCFKSPGVVMPLPEAEYTCLITCQTEIFFAEYREQIIGICGTKGKSTTTTLLYHILKEAGKKVILAGNIGIPVFDIIDQIEPDSLIVIETAGHYLEFMTVSPKTAALTNIHEEHLDHYFTLENYARVKRKIYSNQLPGDLAVINEEFYPAEGTCKSEIITIGYAPTNAMVAVGDGEIAFHDTVTGDHHIVLPVDDMLLFGKHNHFNIGMDYALAMRLGLTDEEFLKGLVTYSPLPHRLQYIGTYDGIKYYNDSISTIGDTCIQALESLKHIGVGTVLIGGMDRGIDYMDLKTYLTTADVDNIIFMAASGKRIYDELMAGNPEFKHPEKLILVETLAEAVEKAKEITAPGKCCVLSPAAASYGIFKNFEERGKVFTELVKGE